MNNKHNIKMIAIDLDGTLLNSNHEVTPKNIEVLRKLQTNGVKIIISTGRPYKAMIKFYNQIGLNDDLICFNGSAIYTNKQEAIWKNTIASEIGQELANAGMKSNVYYHGFTDDKWLIPEICETSEMYKERSGLTETVCDFSDIGNTEFLKVMYIGENEKLMKIHDELEEKFGKRLYKTFSNSNFLEIMNPKSSKARALEFLLKTYGYTKDNLIAFGDGLNDLEMLSMAKIAVVMDNAPKFLKEKFSFTASNNNESGVGKFLEEFFEI